MKVKSRASGTSVIFNNFIVLKKKDTYFGVYERSFLPKPIGDEITHGETLHAACKKAKLLQIGYEIGRRNFYL